MFHFLPLAIRYDGSSPAGGHGYQVHIGPMYSDARGSVKITSPDPQRPPGAALQLPLDRAGPARVGRGDPRRAHDPQPAGVRAVQRRRDLARPGGRDRRARSSTGSRATPRPRCTRRARAGWARRRVGRRPADDARARPRRPARRRRLGDALRHERQHLRAGDDGGREGRRPDPRQHAARAVDGGRSTAAAHPSEYRRRPRRGRRSGYASNHEHDPCGADGLPRARA